MENKKIHIKLPSKIITKLGGALYGGFIPAICETISNSYDADATLATISIDTNKNEVCIEDNGIGMDWETLENSFFRAGKNRRITDQGKTQKGRFVTGKKGLGKFALFGFCKELYIETSNGKNINAFSINIDEIDKSEEDEFQLEPYIYNQPSQDGRSYTKIILKNLNKKYKGLESIASLARRINYIFKSDNDEFLVKFYWVHNGKEELLDRKRREEIVKGASKGTQRFFYGIPESLSTTDGANKIKLEEDDIEYIKRKGIKGFLVAGNKTRGEDEPKGLAIFSRGKICQDPSYFDIQPGNSFGYAYLYGELEIDFLDESDSEDYISTNRKEIEWDKDQEVEDLRGVINRLLRKYAEAYDSDKKRIDKEKMQKKMEKWGEDLEWFNKYNNLDVESKNRLDFLTKAILEYKPRELKKETIEDFARKNLKFIQANVGKTTLICNGYIKDVVREYETLRELYNNALHALNGEDYETVIMKANAICEEVLQHVPQISKIFGKIFQQYLKTYDKQEVVDAISALFKPIQQFTNTGKSPINSLRSSTKTAHNTPKNPQTLNDSHLAQLVLNYSFMYAGFVLGNLELFLQSPDSLEGGQHSQSDEQ